jgi:hypothetical protein
VPFMTKFFEQAYTFLSINEGFHAFKTVHCMQNSIFWGWTTGLYLGGCLDKWVCFGHVTHVMFRLFSGYFVLVLLEMNGIRFFNSHNNCFWFICVTLSIRQNQDYQYGIPI